MKELFEFYRRSDPFLKLLVIDFGIQWIGFIVAAVLQTEKFYDLFGSVSFITLAYLSFKWSNIGHPRQYIQVGCILIWALRLGLFLFTRILKTGKDRRFDKIKKNPGYLFTVWTLQGVWVIVTLLPSILCLMSVQQKELVWKDYIGWGMWMLGFIIETVADYQKSSFRNISANKDKFISSGLWNLSRHPNYFGEILLWFGLYVSASSVFHSYHFISVLCPIFDYFLITRLSGIPPLEKYASVKWGRNPAYQQYVKETPLLVPFL